MRRDHAGVGRTAHQGALDQQSCTARARRMILKDRSIDQKTTETTLIEQFLYPKYGPGQMWETVAQRIKEQGGEIRLGHKIVGLTLDGFRIVEIEVHDVKMNQVLRYLGIISFLLCR